MARLVVAINPSASFGKALDAGALAVEALREAGHEVRSLVAPNWLVLADRAREEVEQGPDALVVVGGDGMVHLGAGIVAGTDVPLGLIPTGTGNDLARNAGIPRHDVRGAVDCLAAALDRGAVAVDTAVASWVEGDRVVERRVVSSVSCGFDAVVNERANRMRFPKGASRYTLAIVRELARLTPLDYRVEHDGGVIEERGILVSVANNRSLGGGMMITPEASMVDGVLDLFFVHALSRTEFLRIYPRVFAGTHVTDPHVEIIRTRHARVEADGVVAYGDGERLGPLPIGVRVDPGSLRFLGSVPGMAEVGSAEESSGSDPVR